jgi:UDP-2,3-diacylglucosamine pyrophosphatase LpxH
VKDAIIISDLHLGAEMSQAKRAARLLSDLPATRHLILAGDVLESSETRLKRQHWSVLSLLRQLSDVTKLVWVKGNHDDDAESVAHLVGAEFVDEFIFPSGDKDCLVIHGHQYDDFLDKHPITTAFADAAYLALQKMDHRLAQMAKRSSKTFLRCCDKVKIGALTYANEKDCNVVICGHTHHAEVLQGNISYYNTGCWVEQVCHYLTVKRGEVKLHEVRT